MSDFFHINDGSANKSIFYANGPMYISSLSAITQTAFQTWQKPNGVNFVHFFVMGAGGGGGNSSLASATAKGGGGGGSAGHVTGLFLASVLPDTLYINVGVGGIGGGGIPGNDATGNGGEGSGGNGALSYVMIYPDTGFTATNVVLQSGSAAAVGGRTGGSVSTNGQAGTVWTPTGILNNLGLISGYAGQAGVGGVAGSVGANLLISGITTGGASGAGTNTSLPINGGSIIGYGNIIPTISGGTSASTLTLSATSGYMLSIPNTVGMANNPIFFAGGAGGASFTTSTGGRGGNAAFGSGGGGGGGVVSGNRGSGGRGGDGIVIITCW